MNAARRRVTAALFAALAIAAWWARTVFAQDCAQTVTDRSAVKVEYESNGAAVGIATALILKTSADGTLRADDTATGSKVWEYRAPETDVATAAGDRMTSLAVLRFDANGDGVIDPRGGDRVWLYFGLKRAGAVYYALDITEKTPRVLWRADGSVMSGLGEAWSTPTIARVRIGGAQQNGEHFVVIVGGGLPASAGLPGTSNSLFMLDAATGRVLWSASDDAPASFISPHMTEAFAARIVAIDFDGDRFADRLYAADVGARVWRFDIWNGRTADQLVTGGVFASLGAVDPLASAADARRFFNAPDVAYIRPRGEAPYYNLSIGSGDAENPGSAAVRERFYALRDYDPFRRRSQSEYDAMAPIFDGDLATIAGTGTKGWKLDLPIGERVLSDSITVNGVVLFTTFRAGNAIELCEATGTNRVYAVKVENAKPALDLDGDTKTTDADVAATLEEGSAVGTPRIELVWPKSGTDPGDGTQPGAPDDTTPQLDQPEPANTRCRVGNEVLRQCVPLGAVVRTFWKRTSVN